MKMMREFLSPYRGLSRSAYILFIARTVTRMGSFIWPMLALILSRKLGYSTSLTALVTIISSILYLPANIIGGKLADRFNRRNLIILFDSVSVLFFFACAFLQPGILMLVFFTIAGWFANLESPIFEAFLSDVTLPEERDNAFSLLYLGANIGMAFGSLLGGLLIENYLSLAFLFDGMTTISTTLLIFFFVKDVNLESLSETTTNEYEKNTPEGQTTFQLLLDRRSVLLQMFSLLLIGFVYDQWSFALPLYMSELFQDRGSEMYGVVAGTNGILVIFLTPIITNYTKKWTEFPKILVGVFLFCSSYLIFSGSHLYPIFFVFITIFTIGEIFNMLGVSPFISRRVPVSHRGRVSSYVFVLFFLGTILGRGVTGLVAEYYSFEIAFAVLAFVGYLSLMLIAYTFRVDKQCFPKLYLQEAGES